MKNSVQLDKYRRTAKIIQILMKIFYRISLIGGILAAVIGTVLLFLPDSTVIRLGGDGDTLNLTLDGMLRYRLVNPNFKPGEVGTLITIAAFMLALVTLIMAPIFKQMSLILGSIEENKPFAPENSRRLQIIGVILVIGAFITRLGEFIVDVMAINRFNLENFDVVYSADRNMLIVGFIVLILAGVFKYGSYLQREYDATV